MPKIRIPLAETDDAKRLKTISMNAFQSDFETYGEYPPGIPSVDWHRDEIRKGYYHKIEYDGNLAGGICLITCQNQEMEIRYFYISPEYQNKKIGTRVMALIEKKYKKIKKWWLFTPYKEFRNHYFYEKLGYKKVGESQPIENDAFTLFRYEKEITGLKKV